MEIGQWFHLGITWSKDADLTVYVNGTQLSPVSSNTYSPSGSLDSDMHVGKNNGGTPKYAEVTSDEWYFWEAVLSEEKMKTIFGAYTRNRHINNLHCHILPRVFLPSFISRQKKLLVVW